MLIDDYRSIASRMQQIIIEEGRAKCPACKNVGWYLYGDCEGEIYYTECDTCHNPLKSKPPSL